ncbi:MAG: cobalamin-dependent protein [Spirochaetes bacterium]|nr:cobalamin-dependent protein [Spirochaetota bacterium]
MKQSLLDIRNAVTEIRDEDFNALVLRCLQEGHTPMEIVEEGLARGLEEVGRRFEEGEYFLADLILAGDMVTGATDMLREKMPAGETGRKGKVVLATVQGDVHDIGKKVVGIMLGASGYEVIDLGTDVPAAKIVETVRATGSSMVGLSALLTTMVHGIGEVVAGLVEAGLRDRVKVAIGGACCSQRLADEMGVDAFGESAIAAVRVFDGFRDGAAI